jgi:hypothetical protein
MGRTAYQEPPTRNGLPGDDGCGMCPWSCALRLAAADLTWSALEM